MLALLLLCLATLPAGTAAVSATLGTSVSIKAATATTLDFTLGPQLIVQADADCNITMSVFTSAPSPIPSGYSVISFGSNADVHVGYTLETIPATVTLSQLQLTSPALSVATAALITGSVTAGALQYNASLSAYGAVSIKSYDVSTQKISVDLPGQGTYLLATVSSTAEIPALWGPVEIPTGSPSTYNFPSGFSLNLNSTAPSKVSVTMKNTTQYDLKSPTGLVSLNQYATIASNNSASLVAVIKFKYTAAMLTATSVAASTLRLARWSANKWYANATGYGVDTTNMLVSQTTTALGQWMVFGGDGGPVPLMTSLGASTSIQANVWTSIDYIAGPQLGIKSPSAATVTVSAYTNTEILPAGYEALSVGATVGYSVTTDPSTVTLQTLQLTTPALSQAAAAQLTGSTQIGMLKFDASTRAYSVVHVKSYDVSTRSLVVDLPGQGNYVIVSVATNAAVPAAFGAAVTLGANQAKELTYPSGVALSVTPSAPMTVTMSLSATTTMPTAAPTGQVPVGVYLTITPNTTASVGAVIKYEYTTAMLRTANATASSLRFAFWNTTSSAWETLSSGFSVDTTAKLVTQTTTHFSMWALVAAPGGTYCGLQTLFAPASYFNGWTGAEICDSMGTALFPPALPDAPSPQPEAPPADYDCRQKASVCFSTPRQQGKCGSCWTFASATALGQRACMKAKLTSQLSLAPQKILDCDTGCQGQRCQQGCNGGYPDLVWKFLQNTGTSADTCQPYEAVQKSCVAACRGSGSNQSYKSTNAYQLRGVTAMMKDIEVNGPIMVSMMVKEDFLDYKSGVYTASSNARDIGGHAVTLLGWGSENGVEYWIGENSWGSSWGINGYFKIRKGVNEVRIEEFPVAGVADTSNVQGGSPESVDVSAAPQSAHASSLLVSLLACALGAALAL